MTEEKLNEYKSLLKNRLNEKRYHHSLCVADEAKFLAVKYGADPEKAFTAGLLHDITKNAPTEEHLKLFKDYNIELSDIEKSSEKLWHAVSGAVYVKFVLGINDEEIISAIRYHTTAKQDMTLLEKVLYIADFTSLDRDYDDIDVIRALSRESLDKAMKYALSYTINELVDKGVAIHNDTFFAYNQSVIKEMQNDF